MRQREVLDVTFIGGSRKSRKHIAKGGLIGDKDGIARPVSFIRGIYLSLFSRYRNPFWCEFSYDCFSFWLIFVVSALPARKWEHPYGRFVYDCKLDLGFSGCFWDIFWSVYFWMFLGHLLISLLTIGLQSDIVDVTDVYDSKLISGFLDVFGTSCLISFILDVEGSSNRCTLVSGSQVFLDVLGKSILFWMFIRLASLDCLYLQ